VKAVRAILPLGPTPQSSARQEASTGDVRAGTKQIFENRLKEAGHTALTGSKHNHFRAHVHPIVEVDHVLVRHADAA
jgi:hypothetical protein